MDQHSIASKRLMDQVMRSRSSYTSSSSGASSRLPPANELEWMHTHTVQNPQLLAQNKKRAAAERAAIQQKIKNDITKSQMEAKKQKENHEKIRLWEDVILPNWDEYASSSKLRELCVRGIPNKLRGRIWPLLVSNELGIDEQMFETLCAEVQLLFHDKMTAARSRRKKTVNRESNAYGNQLHHTTSRGEIGAEDVRPVAAHDPTGHQPAVDDFEEDEDPLDADYYPKQTYILDEDTAMALESEGPYLFHHQKTSHQPTSQYFPDSTTTINIYPPMAFGDTRYRYHSTGHASPVIGQAIPIPLHQQVTAVDVTEEDWFENERNGSLDEETFKIIQKQLFVKPVVLPGIPIPKHLQSSTTSAETQQPSAPPSDPTAVSSLQKKDTQRNKNGEGTIAEEEAIAPAIEKIDTGMNIRRRSAPAFPLQMPAKPSSALVLCSSVPNTSTGAEVEGEPDSSTAMKNLIAGSKGEIASSVGSQYDPNTDFLPFDFDDDDPTIRTPIKTTTTSNPRKHSTAGIASNQEDDREASTTLPIESLAVEDEVSMEITVPMTPPAVHITSESTHETVSAISNQHQQQLVSPIVLKPITRGGSGHPGLARRTVLDMLNDVDEEERPLAQMNADNASPGHEKEETGEEEDEEEEHSILMPRLSRSSGAESAPIDKSRLMSSDLHLVLSRPTSALGQALQQQGESSAIVYSAAHTPAVGGTNNPVVEETPKQEDPPNPKLERLLRVVSLIEWDLPRTFPTLAFFHDGGVMHTGLERILLCFALYYPEIGYVQGLSFLVAMLLLQCMDEYEVFVCLTNIILAPSRGNLQAFYRIEKPSIDGFVACFDYFFKKYLPLLHEHFRRENVESLMFLMDWHLSLFTKALPIEIAAKIWDVYLLEGEVYVLSVGLGILKMYAAKLATYSVEKISKFLLHLPDSIKTDELFTHIAQIHITKKQYERIRKRVEANQTSFASHHLPTTPSAHVSSHPSHHTPRHHSTESSGYFSTSMFKSAVRSSIRVIRTAVASTTQTTSPRNANAHLVTPANQPRSVHDDAINPPRSVSAHSKAISSFSMSGFAASKSSHGSYPSSTSAHVPFQSKQTTAAASSQPSRSNVVGRAASYALYDTDVRTVMPERRNASPVSQPSPGGLRRQVKSVSSLYDLEKNKLRQEREMQRLVLTQQQQEEEEEEEDTEIDEQQRVRDIHSNHESSSLTLNSSLTPMSVHRPNDKLGADPAGIQFAPEATSISATATVASSLENRGPSPVPYHQIALGDDERPRPFLEHQSPYLSPSLTSSPPTSTDLSATPPPNPSIHTDRPTPIAPTRQLPRLTNRQRSSSSPSSPSPHSRNSTRPSGNTNSKLPSQRHPTASSNSLKKKVVGGDCIPS